MCQTFPEPNGNGGYGNHAHRVRRLEAKDKSIWLRLFKGYIEFYKASIADAGDRGDLAPPAGRRRRISHRLVAVDASDTPSAWRTCCFTARPGRQPPIAIWRTCSWIRRDEKRGAGRALIEATYREADARGATRTYWSDAGVQLHGPCAVRPAGNQVAIRAVSALTQAICELALGARGMPARWGNGATASTALLAGAREASAVVALSSSAIAGASGTRSFVAACGDAVVPATALKFSNWG